jgi:excisionase family DNA binding protein
MSVKSNEEWVSLGGAAEILGVHPSTVRAWANRGSLPTHRTQGGHRRFKRREIELWMQNTRQQHHPALADVMQSAVRQIRIRVAEGQLESEAWYQKLDEAARDQYRRSGMVLVQGLLAYLSSNGDQAKSEAHALGYEYASRAHRCELNSLEAVQAFLFFRNTLIEAIIEVYQGANIPSSEAWGEMLRKLHDFTDLILLHLLETYQSMGTGKA